MAVFHGQTVDLYEDFEDALDAAWVETDASGALNPNDAAAKYAGSNGMSIDLPTGAAAAVNVRYTIGSNPTDISVGWWFYTGALGTGATESCPIFAWAAASVGTVNCRAYYYEVSGTGTIRLRGTAFGDNNKTLPAIDAWYWITIDMTQNDTCTLRVYDTTGAEVDAATSVTVTANNNACGYLYFGTVAAVSVESGTLYYDDAVADWTDATFPLLGWETGGGGVAVRVAPRVIYARHLAGVN